MTAIQVSVPGMWHHGVRHRDAGGGEFGGEGLTRGTQSIVIGVEQQSRRQAGQLATPGKAPLLSRLSSPT